MGFTSSQRNLILPSRSFILPVAIIMLFSFQISGFFSNTFGNTTTSIFDVRSSSQENIIGLPVLVTIFWVLVIIPPILTEPDVVDDTLLMGRTLSSRRVV